MEEYHSNLHPIKVLTERKKDVNSPLNAGELKQLRALLGSLQWLVAQVRLDMGYHLSVLQVLGYPLLSKNVDASTDSVGLTVVTDAKDVYDKGTSDTPSYGPLNFLTGRLLPDWTLRMVIVSGVSWKIVRARFEASEFPHRTTFARLDFKNGHCEWRKLEDRESYMDLQNPQALFGTTAAILVTFFHPKCRHESTKEEDEL
eukprot:s2032_g22.t1